MIYPATGKFNLPTTRSREGETKNLLQICRWFSILIVKHYIELCFIERVYWTPYRLRPAQF
jgi:hypothetical protein